MGGMLRPSRRSRACRRRPAFPSISEVEQLQAPGCLVANEIGDEVVLRYATLVHDDAAQFAFFLRTSSTWPRTMSHSFSMVLAVKRMVISSSDSACCAF